MGLVCNFFKFDMAAALAVLLLADDDDELESNSDEMETLVLIP